MAFARSLPSCPAWQYSRKPITSTGARGGRGRPPRAGEPAPLLGPEFFSACEEFQAKWLRNSKKLSPLGAQIVAVREEMNM
jgi:hypothetical protein